MRLPWKTTGPVTECRVGTARARILACPGIIRGGPYFEAWASLSGVSTGDVQDFDTLAAAKTWCRLVLLEEAADRLAKPAPEGQPLVGMERSHLVIEVTGAELALQVAQTRWETARVRWQQQQRHERYQTALLLKGEK